MCIILQDVDINPKTMATEDLYGHISLATREWKDGLLSTIMRDLGAIPNSAPKWIVLDGDLDANWIESMNSVMDDNRVRATTHNSQPTTTDGSVFAPRVQHQLNSLTALFFYARFGINPLYDCKSDPSLIPSRLSPKLGDAV